MKATPSIVLMLGPEVLLRDEQTAALREALANEHGEVDTVRFDGGTVALADVLDECRSFGLMAPYKLVIVDDADDLCAAEERREALIRYAQAPSSAATLLLRAKSLNAPKLKKAIEAAGAVMECETPTAGLPAWIRSRAKAAHKVKIDDAAAELLAARHGNSLARIDGELGKLALAAGGGAVTLELVAAMTGGHQEVNPFAVQAALLSGDAGVALGMLRTILDSAPRDAHVPVGIAAVQAAVSVHELAATGRTKAWGEAGAALQRLRGKVGLREAKDLLDLALLVDVHNKSGVGEPQRNLEILALRFAETLGAQRG